MSRQHYRKDGLSYSFINNGFIPGVPKCPDCQEIYGHLQRKATRLGEAEWHWVCNANKKGYIILEQSHFNVCPACMGKVIGLSITSCRFCHGRGWARI